MKIDKIIEEQKQRRIAYVKFLSTPRVPFEFMETLRAEIQWWDLYINYLKEQNV
tara:strand:- start:750 stop:911 length:162 start_codon:yes stop_codon:yes gene_type:complete